MKKLARVTQGISDASKTLLGKNLSRAVSGRAVDIITPSYTDLVPMKNGSKGKITKKKVPALLHKGEVVLTAGQVKMLSKLLK